MMRRESVRPGAGVHVEEDRTFFCSELVAKAWKLLGILEDDGLSCGNYFPLHFSSRGQKKLKLLDNIAIEPEL